MKEIMGVWQLLERDIDVDIVDDVCEDLRIAFIGPQKLTKEGRNHFASVLDYEVDVDEEAGTAVLMIGNSKYWKSKLEKAKELFYGAAGYCSMEDYDKWFV